LGESSLEKEQCFMRSIRIVVTLSASISIVLAQDRSSTPQGPPEPAIDVQRVPPGGAQPKSVPPLLQQYDFGAQIRTLEETNGLSLPSETVPQVVPGSNGEVFAPSQIPKDYRPKADVPLTATALEAVHVSAQWRDEKNSPSPGPDGRVMYSFGAGLPTVVCAPLRVCIVELQAGEKIVGEPHIGDSVRWNISPAMYGTGDHATSVIVLKPQTPGLDTNLLSVISQDVRFY
jgi:type IV secretion system protein TrbG